ncbi:hypothetical protein QYE76_004063 [Lolium multiflorum]|uniref:Uncharacterized protein n=1 Tax=Lolium multiflorum TaxID=4521 RepID=A0AAD8W1V4_LOLMU|nr:hypothetical protein QYE76_004063 [Lolium multiflorum]
MLQLRTMKRTVEILEPSQASELLVDVTDMTIGFREFGLKHDGNIGLGRASLQQPANKHRGQPTTAHPEACSRYSRKILDAQATAIPLKRPARYLHRKTPPMWSALRSTRKNYGPNSSSQDDASKEGTTSKTPSSPDLTSQI